MKKRIFSILLALALCFSALSVGTLAVEIPTSAVTLPPEGSAAAENGWYRFSPAESGVYAFYTDGGVADFQVYQTRLSGTDFASAEEALADAAQQLEQGRAVLRQAEADYQQGMEQFQYGVKEIEQLQERVQAGRAEYERNKRLLANPLTATDELRRWVNIYEYQLTELAYAEQEMKAAERRLAEGRASLDAAYVQLADWEAEYQQLQSLIVSSRQGRSGEPWLRYEKIGDSLYGLMYQGSEYYIHLESFGGTTLRCTRLCGSFRDVSDRAYYFEPVYWAASSEITKGTGDGLFSPEEPCTRAQVVTFLWRALGGERTIGRNPFRDVNPSAYYYDAVLWAVKNGITQGTDETHFSPEEPCTRAQVVTFLWRALSGEKNNTELRFSDVRMDDYFYHPVSWAASRGITKGTGWFTFSPEDACTRGQVVTFLYRAMA